MGGSPKPYSRRLYRKRLTGFLRANLGVISGLVAIFVVAALMSAVFVDGYVLGVIHGALVVALVALVLNVFHAMTGSIFPLVGAWGEEMTRDVLKAAKRRRLIWGRVDSLAVADGDVDHLVVLRDGRLIAIDSKWHTTKPTRETLERDAAQAARAAQRARSMLRHLKTPSQVTSLVVLWGAGARETPEGAEIGGVPFVAGQHLTGWLKQNEGTRVRRSEARLVIQNLERFRNEVRPQDKKAIPTVH